MHCFLKPQNTSLANDPPISPGCFFYRYTINLLLMNVYLKEALKMCCSLQLYQDCVSFSKIKKKNCFPRVKLELQEFTQVSRLVINSKNWVSFHLPLIFGCANLVCSIVQNHWLFFLFFFFSFSLFKIYFNVILLKFQWVWKRKSIRLYVKSCSYFSSGTKSSDNEKRTV